MYLHLYNTNLHAISMVKVQDLLQTNFSSINENKTRCNKVQWVEMHGELIWLNEIIIQQLVSMNDAIQYGAHSPVFEWFSALKHAIWIMCVYENAQFCNLEKVSKNGRWNGRLNKEGYRPWMNNLIEVVILFY
jgi:hypothetical protein